VALWAFVSDQSTKTCDFCTQSQFSSRISDARRLKIEGEKAKIKMAQIKRFLDRYTRLFTPQTKEDSQPIPAEFCPFQTICFSKIRELSRVSLSFHPIPLL
jgi:hypothetical protein